MKLYYFPGACSLVVHIVLEWVGARYETVELDFESTNSPLYLAINPSGNVPLRGLRLLSQRVHPCRPLVQMESRKLRRACPNVPPLRLIALPKCPWHSGCFQLQIHMAIARSKRC